VPVCPEELLDNARGCQLHFGCAVCVHQELDQDGQTIASLLALGVDVRLFDEDQVSLLQRVLERFNEVALEMDVDGSDGDAVQPGEVVLLPEP